MTKEFFKILQEEANLRKRYSHDSLPGQAYCALAAALEKHGFNIEKIKKKKYGDGLPKQDRGSYIKIPGRLISRLKTNRRFRQQILSTKNVRLGKKSLTLIKAALENNRKYNFDARRDFELFRRKSRRKRRRDKDTR